MENDPGYIYSQYRPPVMDKTFGKHKVSYNGCGPIAIYNAILASGKSVTFDDVISECERHVHLGGLFGMTDGNIKKVLKHFGCKFFCGHGKKKVESLLEKGKVFMVHMNNGFWIFKGRHFVTFTKSCDNTVSVYNGVKKDRTTDYPSFDAFCKSYIKHDHGSIVRLYSIE